MASTGNKCENKVLLLRNLNSCGRLDQQSQNNVLYIEWFSQPSRPDQGPLKYTFQYQDSPLLSIYHSCNFICVDIKLPHLLKFVTSYYYGNSVGNTASTHTKHSLNTG